MTQWQMKKRDLGTVTEEVSAWGLGRWGLGLWGIGESATRTTENAPIWQNPNEIRHMEKTPVDWVGDSLETRHVEKIKVSWQEKVE